MPIPDYTGTGNNLIMLKPRIPRPSVHPFKHASESPSPVPLPILLDDKPMFKLDDANS